MFKRILVIILCVGIVGCSKPKLVHQSKEVESVKEVTKQPLLTESILKEYKETYFDVESDVSIGLKLLVEDTEIVVDNHSMQAASLIKLFIAGCVYENLGEISEDVEYNIHIMISDSDNTAANNLITLLGNGDTSEGMEVVNSYCEKNGYFDTHLGRLLLAPNDLDDNFTSVQDCMLFLSRIYEKQIPGADNILDYMIQQSRRNKIPQGIPDEIAVANKTGELQDVENDVAIIYGEKENYILCIETQNNINSISTQQSIQEISKRIYEELN